MLLRYQEWKDAKEQGLSISLFPKELQPLFSVVDTYHATTQDTNLSVSDLANLVFASVSKNHPYYQGVLEQLEKLDVSDTTTKTLVKSLVTNDKLKNISLAAYEVTEGRKELSEVVSMFRALEAQEEAQEGPEDTFVTDDLESLVNDAVKSPGLKWRLQCLNKMLGPLRGGDFGFIFARPETGKTTFLASECAFFAEQLDEAGGPGLWINNEEQGSKVMLRVYQSSLGVTLAQLYSDIEGNKRKYIEKTHGKLKLYDSGNIHKSKVEQLCRQLKPSFIVIDQIDAIKGFDSDREDLRLGAIYQWARELAKEFHCPIIGVCQADGTAEGVKWLTMGHVANAKTAKQAMADFILGIGKVHDSGYETLRYLHASKNKLAGGEDSDPNMRHGKIECLIEPHVAHYRDL